MISTTPIETADTTADARDAIEQLDEFRRASSAEDYFRALGVPFEARVVAVNRLHILRLLALRIADLDTGIGGPQPSPEVLLAAYRQGLVEAYEAFVEASALDHRLFKVLRDHDPTPVVPVEAILVRRDRQSHLDSDHDQPSDQQRKDR